VNCMPYLHVLAVKLCINMCVSVYTHLLMLITGCSVDESLT